MRIEFGSNWLEGGALIKDVMHNEASICIKEINHANNELNIEYNKNRAQDKEK